MKTKSKAAKKSAKKESYTYVEKNIYKNDSSYRVRVSGHSVSEKTLTGARRARKILKSLAVQGQPVL